MLGVLKRQLSRIFGLTIDKNGNQKRTNRHSTHLLANYLTTKAAQDQQEPEKKSQNTQTPQVNVLRLENFLHDNLQVKFAILHINRMQKIRLFYLQKEEQRMQEQKRH